MKSPYAAGRAEGGGQVWRRDPGHEKDQAHEPEAVKKEVTKPHRALIPKIACCDMRPS